LAGIGSVRKPKAGPRVWSVCVAIRDRFRRYPMRHLEVLVFNALFDFCNRHADKKAIWTIVEIVGWVVMLASLAIAAPMVDVLLDTRDSFGAGEVVGDLFDHNNPLRVVIYNRWVITDEIFSYAFVAAFFSLSIGGRIGYLMCLVGNQYRSGFISLLVRPHWLFPIRVWVKADQQKG